MPDQLVANLESGLPVPSLTRAIANVLPELRTEVQSTVPWYSDTSTPSTVALPGHTASD
jgi:hypothetical protein